MLCIGSFSRRRKNHRVSKWENTEWIRCLLTVLTSACSVVRSWLLRSSLCCACHVSSFCPKGAFKDGIGELLGCRVPWPCLVSGNWPLQSAATLLEAAKGKANCFHAWWRKARKQVDFRYIRYIRVTVTGRNSLMEKFGKNKYWSLEFFIFSVCTERSCSVMCLNSFLFSPSCQQTQFFGGPFSVVWQAELPLDVLSVSGHVGKQKMRVKIKSLHQAETVRRTECYYKCRSVLV